jgi:hypothetical protein
LRFSVVITIILWHIFLSETDDNIENTWATTPASFIFFNRNTEAVRVKEWDKNTPLFSPNYLFKSTRYFWEEIRESSILYRSLNAPRSLYCCTVTLTPSLSLPQPPLSPTQPPLYSLCGVTTTWLILEVLYMYMLINF